MPAHDALRLGVQLTRASEPLFEEQAPAPPAVFVRHVVRRLVVGEHGVQAGERAREIVVLRHAPFGEGVQHAVLFGDRNVLPRYVVQ